MANKRKSAAENAIISGVLSEKEIAEIKAKAADKAIAEKKKIARDAVMEEALESALIENGVTEIDPAEEMQELEIDLAPYTDRIKLDNKIYMHGGRYTVRKAVADTLREICHRSWQHQAEVDGKKGTRAEDRYRPRNTVVSAKVGTINAPRAAA